MSEPIQIQAPLTLRDQLEARAQHPELRDRVFLMQDERSWTYGQTRNEAIRVARLLRQRLGPVSAERPGHVAMLLENHLELVSLLAGCAYGGYLLFGINTGLRGEVLAGLLRQSRARVLVVDEKLWPEAERVLADVPDLPAENVFVLPTQGAGFPAERSWQRALDSEVGPASDALTAPDAEITPADNLMIIYTSGTTGLPKGINNNHAKLCIIGTVVGRNMNLGVDDVGYANMPLYHSNALFVGLMPAFIAGGKVGLRERFTASRFLDDLRQYGCTYWNYVGEPVHYVLAALERQYDGDAEKIIAAIQGDPRIKLRFALGNGAAPPDIDRLTRYFGLEDMFELYGSTEAAISTFRQKGDPRGSVGKINDPAVKILDPSGAECPPAELDADGKILNYDEAVGEICRVSADTALFQGYFDNADANSQKFRDGIYHSGDLGHVQLRDGSRYLFFDGRTDDWIRKDGENFSAAQIGRILSEHPDVALAVAYGVPCSVSDELVMTAIKLRQGARFDPKDFYLWVEAQVTGGSMDRKWFPDFVRLVEDFEYTETQKVLVRNLKRNHYNCDRLVGEPLYWRVRGDTEFREFTKREYETVKRVFAKAERLHLLER